MTREVRVTGKTKTARYVLTAVIILTAALIWSQSFMSGEASAQESGTVRAILVWLFGDRIRGTWLYLHIRKAAHFAEFAVLGAEWALWRLTLPAGPRRSFGWLTAAAPIPVACCDELIQLTSAGRAASIADVLLDIAGAVCGWAVMTGIAAVLCRFLRKKRAG